MKMLTFLFKCGLFWGSFIATTFANNQVFTLRLKQAPLVSTLQHLAAEQNMNLIIEDSLDGTISLQLENTDLDQVLRSVAKIKQLNLWQENGVYYLNQMDSNAKFALPMEVGGEIEDSNALEMSTAPAADTATLQSQHASAPE